MSNNELEQAPTGFNRNLELIKALIETDRPSTAILSERLGIPTVSIHRTIAKLREDFLMEVEFVRSAPKGQRGNIGYFVVNDWGIIDKHSFIRNYIKGA